MADVLPRAGLGRAALITADQLNRAESSTTQRGLRAGLLSNEAGNAAMERDKALAAGDMQTAAAWHAEQQAKQAEAQNWSPGAPTLEQALKTGEGLGDWARAGFGQGVGSTIQPMAGGVAGLGAALLLRNRLPLAAGRVVTPTAGAVGGAAVPAYNMETNEAALTAAADPTVMATTTPQQRIAVNRIKGGVNTVGEVAVPAMLARSLVGGGAQKLAAGAGPAAALKVGTGTVGKAVGGEALTEVAQEGVGLAAHSALNPNRDTSHDAWQLAEAAAQGGMVGGGLSLPSAAIDATLSAAGQGGDRSTELAKRGADAAAPVVAGAVDATADAATAAWGARPRTWEEFAAHAGKAAVDVKSAAVDAKGAAVDTLDRLLLKGQDTDLDHLLRPQRGMKGGDLIADDATKNVAATNLAQEVLKSVESVPPSVKAAAERYMQGPKTLNAWSEFSQSLRGWQRVDVVKDAAGKLHDSMFGQKKGKANAQRPADDFDPLLADALFPHTGLTNGDDILNDMPKIVSSTRRWIENGLPLSKAVLKSVSHMFTDPAKAVAQAVDMMVQEGYAEAEKVKPLLAQVVAEFETQRESKKHEASIVEDNLRLTAQEKHKFSGEQHEQLAQAVKEQIHSGRLNEARLDELFGTRKEAVLEALRIQMERDHQIDKQSEATAAPLDSAEDIGSSEIEPNVVQDAAVHHMYGDKPYSVDGVITDKVKGQIGTHEQHAADAAANLSAKNASTVKRQGYMDYLHELHADNQDARDKAKVDFLVAHRAELQGDERIHPEQALNKKYFVLREVQRSDKFDAIDIPASEFKTVSGGAKNRHNTWGIGTGKNNEYGTAEAGALWFERADGTRFATSTAKIIDRMRDAHKQGKWSASEAVGLVEQQQALLAGISSILNAEGAVKRMGVLDKEGPVTGVRWLGGEQLPDNLKLYDGTLGEARGITTKEERAERQAKVPIIPATGKEIRQERHNIEDGGEAGSQRSRIDRSVVYARESREDAVERTEFNKVNEGTDLVDEMGLGKNTSRLVDEMGYGEREFDEATGEELHPRVGRRALKDMADAIGGNKLPTDKHDPTQVAFLIDVLRKGMPAFNAMLKKATAEQKVGMQKMIADMLATNSSDAPIWHGAPPRDITAFHARARLAMEVIDPEWKQSDLALADDYTPEPGATNLGPARGGADLYFNRQRPQSFDSERRATPEELSAANDYINTTLGQSMKLAFVDDLNGDSATWTPELQGNVIRITTNAVGGVLTNAYHESMHEFFDRLVKGEHGTVSKLLLGVANNAIVTRSLERILQDYPEAVASLADPEERLAYAYQFWAAGHPLLKLGPKAETLFEKVAKFIRKVTGLLRDDEKAEAIFRQFKEGKLQDASVAGKVLADLNNSQQRVAAVAKKMEPFRRATMDLIGSAEDNLLRSKNPALQHVGKLFADHNNGYIQAHDRAEKQWLGALKKALEGFEKDDVTAALDGLQTGMLSKDKQIRAIQTGVRGLLDEMLPYLQAAGVSVFDVETKQWSLIKQIKNYFPRVWDMDVLSDKGSEFIALLQEHHGDILQKLADQANEAVAKGGNAGKGTASAKIKDRPITPEDVASSIYNRLVMSNGMEDPELQEEGYSLGFSPFMKAVNHRSLKWLDMTKFAQFQSKDLVSIMSGYVMQATKRAEYTRRFGPDGSKLRDLMADAHEFETASQLHEDPKLTKQEAAAAADKVLKPAQRAVMAMEGTLGHDITPALRKAQGWVLAYQNWRMLPMALFANLADPLGILVRGGTLDDAINTYKTALQDVVNGWRGKARDDNLTHMAELIGTIDAHGYLNSMGTMMNSIYLGGGARRTNDALFRINGMETLNRSIRTSATQAAIGFIKRHATQPNEHSTRLLGEMYLDAEYVKAKISDGALDVTDERIQRAVAQWVNEAVLRPNSAQRPSRGSDPHWALVMHFKGFMYSMYKQILGRAAREARLGNYTAASVLAFGYIPVMFGADMAKLIVQNGIAGNADMPAWWRGMDAKDHAMYAVERAGLFGPAQIAVDAVEYGPSSMLGPTGEQLASMFTDPAEKTAMKALPWHSFFSAAQRSVTEG